MAFNQITEKINEAASQAKEVGKGTSEYYKLRVMKSSAEGIISIVKLIMYGVVGSIALLFLSIALAYWIGSIVDSLTLGFLYVGLAYLAILLLIFLFAGKAMGRVAV